MLINIIGCGRVGKTLGYLLHQQKVATIQSIHNRSAESAQKAIAFIGAGEVAPLMGDLKPAHIYFIATSDDAIRQTAELLAPHISPGSIVAHFSGSLSSSVLEILQQKGCHTASLHPVRSFASPETAVKHFQGTLCGLEGDVEACRTLSTLFEQIGAQLFPIEKEKKSLYHTGCVFASNYLVTLADCAIQCYEQSGFSPTTARRVATLLMSNVVSNLEKAPPPQALTGPLQRGDYQTVSKHIEAAQDLPPLAELYKKLGLLSLKLTTLNTQKKEEFEALFTNSSVKKS